MHNKCFEIYCEASYKENPYLWAVSPPQALKSSSSVRRLNLSSSSSSDESSDELELPELSPLLFLLSTPFVSVALCNRIKSKTLKSLTNNRMGREVVGPGGTWGRVQGVGSDHWGTSSQP